MKPSFFKQLKKGDKLWNSGAHKFMPGMSIVNANGDIDASTLGYQYTIQTTTQIRASVIEQKFYKVAPADFMPVIIGTGAWMEDIKTNLVYDVAAPFETGIISTASGPTKIGNVDVGTAPVNAKITTWAKGYTYATPEVQKALAADNWDVISSKLAALKRNWDLGIQKIAFLGLLGDTTNTPGLLTNANVTVNSTVIQGNISAMSSTDFQTLVSAILGAYIANAAYTAMPNTFAIPMDDYVGLGASASSDFPITSKLEYLTNMFKMITGNASFQIKPLAYGVGANNAGYVSQNGKSRYVLYNNETETLAMDIPVDFTLTPAGTSNNFNWQGVGAGQFTGCIIYRPAEVIYFDHN
jgi:hypothetical protein